MKENYDKQVLWESKVSAEDRIPWEIEEQPLFEVTISEDKMLAYLHLHALERKTVQLSEVVARIEQMSIKARIEFAAIQQELLVPTYEPVIVARGKEPIPGKDARLEIYFSQQVMSEFFEVGGAIDFRNHLRIPTVNKGDVMAKKFSPIDGVIGYDVLGSVTVPDPPKDLLIVAKSNVELTPDGTVIARVQGRPRITGGKIKTFDVSTSYIVSGNVDIETGNIGFSGDVTVYGDVTDNMIIESLGNVYVFGNVFNSTITATGSINVRGNVIASKLYSGFFGVLFNRLYNTSKLLCDYIEKLLAASKMLTEAFEAKRQTLRFGQIVLLLLETKMKEITATVKELLYVISNIQHIKQGEYEKLKEISTIFSQPPKLLEIATYGFVQSFLALLRDTHNEVARMQEEKVEISINQCQNSELKSNGDIVIHRDGVVLCNLLSAGNIIFRSDHSICRGSRLEAGDSISAKVIGGQTGANSVLKAKLKIRVKKMYSGRVCIGKYCTDIFEPVDNTTFDTQTLKKHG
ncbi:FapA family protein [Cohnella luojiensis]|uniref:FapA family protein n=1 Tax=Cohnella luojiensis TaxID=652876 RepID=UPI00142FD308|nr:FapA family protein [Cohnella luojiensis]